MPGIALKNDGTVWKWGGGGYLQGSVASLIQSINNVTKISIGNGHILAIKNDGTLWAWGGTNEACQLGTTYYVEPVRVIW
jgi:alpha-tubulin suppressor-like RCC1 family protein